ncbi:MAG: hypothetical protein ABI306_08225 [Caulobacteraceae bacterium]
MTNAWTENGPVSLPPRSLAYGAGALLVALAVAGVALGLRAAWREAGAPDLGAGPTASTPGDDTLTAKPIVDLPPPVAAPEPAKDEPTPDQVAADQAKADAIAAKTAAAQEIQAKPSKPAGNIDDILTSTSEKPPAPAKAAPDEAPPGAPVKTDVPF